MKRLKVTVDGQEFEVEVEPLESVEPSAPATDSAKPSGGGEVVPSPLAGKVVGVNVKEGDRIEEGDTVLVLEAMKMNTLVSSPSSGTVSAIHVAAGEAVEEGQELISID